MSLTVLGVSYPFAPVGADSVGGAEQVLWMLDRALVRRGHRSIIVAPEGSRVAGELVSVPCHAGPIDDVARATAAARHRSAIERLLESQTIDLVHLHGFDFARYLPPPGVPVLVTLHLPPGWYGADLEALQRPRTFFVCVSASQRAALGTSAEVIDNGVCLDLLDSRRMRKRAWAFALGRICPEKGFPLALDAARRAGVPLLLAGATFPYPAHERHFAEEICPRLDRHRRFLGPVGLERKRRLLGAARCLVIPSLAPETSSLCAMEALACGTPVIASRAGALAEIIEDGETGFLVDDESQMADAIREAPALGRERCLQAARERFSSDRMVTDYVTLYRRILAESTEALRTT